MPAKPFRQYWQMSEKGLFQNFSDNRNKPSLLFSLFLFCFTLGCYSGHQPKTSATQKRPSVEQTDLQQGKKVYMRACASCHKADGSGKFPDYPPLVNSPYIRNNAEFTVKVILEGMKGPIEVHGKKYNSVMPPIRLNDDEIADVVNFLLKKLDNGGGSISVEEVSLIRENLKSSAK